MFENARVRVKNVTFPGVTSMHTHDLPHVGVAIEGGTLEFRYPDGKSETMKLEPGGVGYRDANVTHQPVNTGNTPVRVHRSGAEIGSRLEVVRVVAKGLPARGSRHVLGEYAERRQSLLD